VVTVDCGVRAVKQVDRARRGLEFIITDHHSVGPDLPFASAVINPKRRDCPYPFKELAGVGVAFKLAQALIRQAPDHDIPVHVEERALLDLVAIGTVADLAPLKGENRSLVTRGLEVINEAHREGVRALLRVAGLRAGRITSTDIGFGLGPRLNAAGRLGDAELAYDLLVTPEPGKARRLAERLNEQNQRRKELTEEAYERAEEIALADGADKPILWAADGSFAPGIVGLVAGRLTEAHYRPSVIIEQGDRVCKGSCRSIAEFHITEALDECQDLLVRHGGHAAAAGFTVLRENLDGLLQRLSGIAERELGDKELAPALTVDADVPLAEMSWATAEWLKKMEPCGYANPAPVFVSRSLQVLERRRVGSDGKHLKLTLAEGSEIREAIAFRLGDRADGLGDRVDAAYNLQVNEWNGERQLQLNVQDIQASEA
jgi:single-stranded-DNA-specific exonuclease